MNRVCRIKATGKVIEWQTGYAPSGTLIENAVNAGYNENDVEELYVEDSEFETFLINSRTQEEQDAIAARQAKMESIANTLSTNLPSYAQVQTAIDNIANLADAKAFLKKLAAVVYVHVKNDNV